jgi:hypothetical protein
MCEWRRMDAFSQSSAAPSCPLRVQAVLKLFGTRQVEARHRFCDLLSIKVCESTFGPPKMLPEASCAT